MALWLLDLIENFTQAINPAQDKTGLALEMARMPKRIRRTKSESEVDDFSTRHSYSRASAERLIQSDGTTSLQRNPDDQPRNSATPDRGYATTAAYHFRSTPSICRCRRVPSRRRRERDCSGHLPMPRPTPGAAG